MRLVFDQEDPFWEELARKLSSWLKPMQGFVA